MEKSQKEKIKGLLEEFLEESWFVTGDCHRRLAPNAGQFVNTTKSWIVGPSKSRHDVELQLQYVKEAVRKYLEKYDRTSP